MSCHKWASTRSKGLAGATVEQPRVQILAGNIDWWLAVRETAQNSTPGFYLPLIKDKGKVDLDRARQSKKTYKSNKLAVRKSSSICGHSCIMLYLVAMSFCFRHVLSCQIKMQHGVAQLIGTGCLASYFLAMDVKSWRITEARWSSPDKLIGRNIRDYKKGRKN
jgi:hypothetical protein